MPAVITCKLWAEARRRTCVMGQGITAGMLLVRRPPERGPYRQPCMPASIRSSAPPLSLRQAGHLARLARRLLPRLSITIALTVCALASGHAGTTVPTPTTAAAYGNAEKVPRSCEDWCIAALTGRDR